MSQKNAQESRQPEESAIAMEIDVAASAQLLDSDDPPLLLDVREPDERAFCNLGPGPHVPTGEIQFKWNSLPRDEHILVYCHHGMRSLAVTRFLREKGYGRVQSMQGGIEAWSRQIDPSVPRY
jgi:rhodanese-related sulfurtransferase